MTEECPKCRNTQFSIARDMKSTRICRCGNVWLPMPEREAKLLEIIKCQQEALAFYSEINNWEQGEAFLIHEKIIDDLDQRFIWSDYHLVGGKRARSTLAKTKKMMEEVK